MSDFLLLPIVAAVVSTVVQVIKNSVGTSRTWTIITVVALSIAAGFLYSSFRDTAVWQTALQITVYANAVYGFVISYFEE